MSILKLVGWALRITGLTFAGLFATQAMIMWAGGLSEHDAFIRSYWGTVGCLFGIVLARYEIWPKPVAEPDGQA